MKLVAFWFGLALSAACHHAKPISMAPLSRTAYSHYFAGALAMYRQDYTTAIDELTAAAAAAPDQPMIAITQAQAFAKAKRDAAARDVLTAARRKWPDHAQVWLASGTLLESSAPRDAMSAYRRAIELERDGELGYLGLARVQLAQHDDRGAERTLRSLVARAPNSVDGHYRLAQRLELRNDLAAAVVELRAVIEHDPDHIDARIDLARTLRRLGKIGEAIVQTRSAFDRAGQPLDVAEELFWLLCESDDRQAAVDLLTLLDDDRSDADALATVARLDLGLGRIPEARAVIDRITTLDTDAGALALSQLQLATHELSTDHVTPAAAATAGSIAESSPHYVSSRRIAAAALLDARQPKVALDTIATARHTKPRDPELALIAATALADTGSVAEGRAIFIELRKAEDDLAIQLAHARFEDHVHDAVAALAILEPIVRAYPHNVTALNLAGYLLAERKQRFDDAERYLRHARELAPGDPAILDSWGYLLLQKGKPRDAIAALDRASRFAPLEPEILLHLATAWAAAATPKTAADLLDRAAALHPSRDVQRRIDDLRKALVIR